MFEDYGIYMFVLAALVAIPATIAAILLRRVVPTNEAIENSRRQERGAAQLGRFLRR